jgi:large subunit ribosomal protein L15
MPLLNKLSSKIKRKKCKLLGRGNATGHGTFCGRGVKGQKSRTGGKIRRGFEGGQTPLARKMPKVGGFKSPNMVKPRVLNVSDLEKLASGKNELTLSDKKRPYKLLGDGEITKALTVKIDKASKSAIEKVEKAGGKVEILFKVLPPKILPEKKSKKE